MTTNETPRVYIACLAAYNAGTLHGEWVDVTSEDDLRESITRILAASPVAGAEEWAIHDYEGFHGVKIGEYPDLTKLADLAANLEAHGEAFAIYIGHVGAEWDDESGFEDAYVGEYSSDEEFAEQLTEDLYGSDLGPLSAYIDYARFARDLFMGDYWSEGGYVFRSI